MFKITHITSVHNRYDTRIFAKECCSLALNGNYNVSLVVADGKKDEIKNGVSIYGVRKANSRLNRFLKAPGLVLKKAINLDSDIYHLHDPELVLIGLRLIKLKKKVIFDVHENIFEQIKSKEYLPKIFKDIFSFLFKYFDKKINDTFDIVLAEDSYNENYSDYKKRCITVLNMPELNILDNFKVNNRSFEDNDILYVGGITKQRGIKELCDSIRILDSKQMKIKLHLVGPDSSNFEKPQFRFGSSIIEYGFLPISEAYRISRKVKVGVSILHPIPNYIKSYSTKIFEYMAIGLPVVTSDFQLYKDVVEKYNCGICVNPKDPDEISNAIEYIITNPKIAKEMGLNGIKAVKEFFNWDLEKTKLLTLYKELLNE